MANDVPLSIFARALEPTLLHRTITRKDKIQITLFRVTLTLDSADQSIGSNSGRPRYRRLLST